MSDHSQNTRRIAKNTIFLYIRMLVMMAVSLFTFRELLKQLGVDDYGTYNVVGGVVILFSFLSNAMTQSNQRFISYHIGKGDNIELSRIFSMIINVQVVICILIVFLAETIGLWFINCKMNFEPGTMTAVNWVYQFSIFTFVIQILQIPYTSAIISHEKMSFFSYFSIGEALIKLGVVLSLSLFTSNRLIIYSALLMFSALLIFSVYFLYCNKAFRICHYSRIWSGNLFRKLISFSGWNMLGGLGNVAAGQGINILFNLFCGVVVNAAMGVSQQVSSAVTSLVSNLQVAFNPQIIKSYASNDIDYYQSLIFRGSRLSFFLIYIVGLPIIICINPILHLWLADVPEYAAIFTRLTILFCMIDALSGSLWIGAQAIGNIGIYTLCLTTLTVLYLPLSYYMMSIGYSPAAILVVRISLSFVLHIYRIIYLSFKMHFNGWSYVKDVTFRAFVVLIISGVLLLMFKFIVPLNIESLYFLPIYILISITLGWVLLIKSTERNYIVSIIKKFIQK